jgi:hypothetical protein
LSERLGEPIPGYSDLDEARLSEALQLEPEYAAIRKYLKSMTVTFAEGDRGDGSDYGFDSYTEMRRKVGGKIRIRNEGGVSPDGAYVQLQEEFGKGFFPDGFDHPLDRWGHILRVLDDANNNREIINEGLRVEVVCFSPLPVVYLLRQELYILCELMMMKETVA